MMLCVRRRLGGLCLYAVAVLPIFGCGGGGADGGSSDFAGTVYYQIDAGDLDGDALTDLAVIAVVHDGDSGTADPAELQVLLQDVAQPGHFALKERLSLAIHLGAVAVADLDGDDRLDIAVTEPGSNNVRIFLQDPVTAGQFAQKETRAAANLLSNIKVADIDLDGLADLILSVGSGVLALRQDSAAPGTFPFRTIIDDSQDSSTSLSASYDSLAVGDLSADDLVDVATVRADSDARMYFQDVAVPGTFQPTRLDMSLRTPMAVSVGDINRDGFTDVAAAGTDGSLGAPIARMRLQDRARPGTFLAELQVLLVDRGAPRSVVIADVTDDDLPDLLVAKSYAIDAGTVEVWVQTGPTLDFRRLGVFTALNMARVAPNLRGFAVADFNDDGLPDIVVTDGELACLFNDARSPGQFRPAVRLLQ